MFVYVGGSNESIRQSDLEDVLPDKEKTRPFDIFDGGLCRVARFFFVQFTNTG
jgi:hypothetical protein